MLINTNYTVHGVTADMNTGDGRGFKKSEFPLGPFVISVGGDGGTVCKPLLISLYQPNQHVIVEGNVHTKCHHM